MAKELIVRLKDDFDGSYGDDVQTREFSWGGVDYETELRDDNFLKMDAAIRPFLKNARVVKKKGRQRRKRSSANAQYVFEKEPAQNSMSWTEEIHDWAADHGYDWNDKDVRKQVRDWCVEQQLCSRTGTLPREAFEAYHRAQQ